MGRNKEFQKQVDRAEGMLLTAITGYPEHVRSAALSQAHGHDAKRRKAVKELSEAKRHLQELEKRVGTR